MKTNLTKLIEVSFIFLAILLFSNCKKSEIVKEKKYIETEQMAGIAWRKSLTKEELNRITVFKEKKVISRPSDIVGGESPSLSPAASCDLEGDIFMTRYEFPQCAGPGVMNFYVRVVYGTGTIPEGVQLTIQQVMSGGTTRQKTLSTPASVTQIEPGVKEYKFVLDISTFDICTQGTSDLRGTPFFLLRCPATREVVSMTSTQTFGTLPFNCMVYNISYSTSPGQLSFSLPILACGSSYGRCSGLPTGFIYQYRLKGTTTWTNSPVISMPYGYTVSLPAGTYEVTGHANCTDAQTPISEVVVP